MSAMDTEVEYISYSLALPELDRVRGEARWGQGFGECLGGRGSGPKHYSHMQRGTVWDQLLRAGSQQDLGTSVCLHSVPGTSQCTCLCVPLAFSLSRKVTCTFISECVNHLAC